jgi:hypothetical protein
VWAHERGHNYEDIWLKNQPVFGRWIFGKAQVRPGRLRGTRSLHNYLPAPPGAFSLVALSFTISRHLAFPGRKQLT